MNAAMYEHPATQANLALLRERGAIVLEPGTGSLASLGEEGVGRLPEPPELLAAIERALAPRAATSTGSKVLVTAGGTREPIDAVRFVGNRSSGRMGFALAEAAARRGADVTVIAANVSLPRRAGRRRTSTSPPPPSWPTRARRASRDADVLLMAAAVADYRPAAAHAGKIKKDEAGEELNLRLERTDGRALRARRRPPPRPDRWSASPPSTATARSRTRARSSSARASTPSCSTTSPTPAIGFDAAENEVVVVTAAGDAHVPRAAKADVAGAILDMVLSDRSSTPEKVTR